MTLRGAGVSASSTQAFPLTIETLPIIQVSLTMAVDMENFYQDEFVSNIAYLLNIEKERVRVVKIVAGSVGVDLEIGPPLCTDTMLSGNESDVDCGKDCSSKCLQGKMCNGHSDCESGSCQSGTCAAPSCHDNVLSPSLAESCIDGGGTCATKCADTQQCSVASDCISGRCLQNICAAPTCTDTIKNQNEQDVDCGGSGCPGCLVGMSCTSSSHCVSNVCLMTESNEGKCLKATCFDGVKNGVETGPDCGGSGDETLRCSRCASGFGCESDSDCASSKCTLSSKTCAVATATDQRKNNKETFVDCGGPLTAARCRVGQTCTLSSDCESKNCNNAGKYSK